MKLLLDTHALLWAVEEPSKLGATAMAALQDPSNVRILSAATIWEFAIKLGQGKFALSMPYRQWLTTAIADLGLEILPITVDYGERYAMLPSHHKDPFDRLMIAQDLVDGVPIVGVDAAFDPYGVTRIW